jgi:hypothetical protein
MIGCNLLGFHMLGVFSKSRPLNVECYRNTILSACFRFGRMSMWEIYYSSRQCTMAQSSNLPSFPKWKWVVARRIPTTLAWSRIIRVFLFENVKHFIEGVFFWIRQRIPYSNSWHYGHYPDKSLYGVCEYRTKICNKLLKTIIITIHRLTAGWFSFG